MNPVLLTDSYKVSHWKQYPLRTTRIFSFLESRGGEFPETLFFGLQYLLKKYLVGRKVTIEDVWEAESFFKQHFGQDLFNTAGWLKIAEAHQGRLPVRICALEEGSRTPTGTVLMTVENTDPDLPWLTNYLETLLVQVWYPITVATQSYAMKQMILDSLEKTGDPTLIDFKLHDFGFRGSTSVESSAIGGAAHLVNFLGTDTVSALSLLRDYYGEPMAGFSIPAAEHSTITSWGKRREGDAFANMLEQYPTGLVAVVSDSYDIFHACRELWGSQLRGQVMSRNGTLVVRPDSGHPPTVVCQVLEILGQAFGVAYNKKGFKLLDPHVRVIQGDGIDKIMLPAILQAMDAAGWSADNVAFGSGGGLLQKVNRDTCRFAFKCSAMEQGGVWKDVMKDPITDPSKKSKAGRFLDHPALTPVFEDGKLLRETTLATIRQRVKGESR